MNNNNNKTERKDFSSLKWFGAVITFMLIVMFKESYAMIAFLNIIYFLFVGVISILEMTPEEFENAAYKPYKK
jgi:hypothetical protein